MSSDNALVTMISKVAEIMAMTCDGIAAQAHLVDLVLVGMVLLLLLSREVRVDSEVYVVNVKNSLVY